MKSRDACKHEMEFWKKVELPIRLNDNILK